jgi:hypothetical protein
MYIYLEKYVLLFVYLIILGLQYLFVKYYIEPDKKSREILFNLKNIKELDKTFVQKIQERLDKLDTMSYYDWIDYNNKYIDIEVQGKKYQIAVFEQVSYKEDEVSGDTDYILRVNKSKQSRDLMYSDIIKEVNYNLLFDMFSPNPAMLNQMYSSSKAANGPNQISYYWVDDTTHRATKNNYTFNTFTKKEGKKGDEKEFTGIIYFGYEVTDIEAEYSNKYYDYCSTPFLIYVSLLILVSSYILHYSTKNTNLVKPLALLIGTNAYLTFYLNQKEGLTSLEKEQDKSKDINDGLLGLTFLIGVNTYVIDTLKGSNEKYTLHTESAFLFCLSLILLLSSLYKKTNYNKIDGVRGTRIEKQFMYNLSIFINIFVLMNYLLFVGTESKTIKMILNNFGVKNPIIKKGKK